MSDKRNTQESNHYNNSIRNTTSNAAKTTSNSKRNTLGNRHYISGDNAPSSSAHQFTDK